MVQSTSTAAHRRSQEARKPTASVTEAARFLSKFYQKEATRKALKVPGLSLDIPNHDGGNASTSIYKLKTVEFQAKDLNQRQHPRDMPAIMSVKDTGEAETLWSPSEQPDRSPSKQMDRSQRGQDVQDLEGKEGETIQSIHMTTANMSTDVSRNHRTNESLIQPVDRSSERERPDLGRGMDIAWLLRLHLCDGLSQVSVGSRFKASQR